MKLGVAGLIPDWDRISESDARRVHDHGFSGASVFFPSPLDADYDAVRRTKSILSDAGVEVAQANGRYEMLVSPDPRLRREGVRGIQALCRIGSILDARSVYVRPGSVSRTGPWYPHPENTAGTTFDRLVDSLAQAAGVAEGEGVTLALEGHVLSPVESPTKMRAVLDAVGSPSLKANIDPVNFIGSVQIAYGTRSLIAELFDLLGNDIVAAHLKDVVIEDRLVLHISEVVPGEGTLDCEFLLQNMNSSCPSGYCLIEHLPDEQIAKARDAVLSCAVQAGISFA